jgi:4a-hydroxytetrahydrobiopterin dehydratase
MAVLSDDEVRQGLADLEGWEREADAIVRQVGFDTFPDAVAFVVRLAFDAEAANHHPDLDIRYNKVRVALSTHSEGGITAKDLELARAIQAHAPAPSG